MSSRKNTKVNNERCVSFQTIGPRNQSHINALSELERFGGDALILIKHYGYSIIYKHTTTKQVLLRFQQHINGTSMSVLFRHGHVYKFKVLLRHGSDVGYS